MQYNQLLKYSILILIFTFPLVVASVRHGGTIIYVLLFLLSLVFGWRGWKLLQIWEKRVLLGLLIFFLLSILSYINTENFREGVKHLENFVRFIAIVPIYCMVRYYAKPTTESFIASIVVGAIILGLQAWYEVQIHNASVADGAYHKIVFGDTAILFAVILLAALFTLELKKWQVLICIAAVIAGVYASVLSLTRGAWLLIPILIPLWLWMYRGNFGRKGWLVAGLVIVVSVTVGVIWQPEKVKLALERGMQDLHTYQEHPSAPTSWGIRLNLWHDSVTIFQEHPVIGTGIGDLSADRKRLGDPDERAPGAREKNLANNVYLEGEQAHSIYFQALATRGIIGFIALAVCLLILPLYYFYIHWEKAQDSQQRFYVLGGVSFIVAFAVFGLSEGWLTRNPFVNLYAMFLIVFMLGIASSFNKSSQQIDALDI